MKKFLISCMAIMLLFSCSTTSDKKANPSNQSLIGSNYKIDDFFPFNENIRMKYAGKGNEFAEKDVYVDYITANRIQLRVINPGTTLAQIIEKKNGQLSLILSREEFYYRENLLNEQGTKAPEVLLMEPIKAGTTWTLEDGRKRYISKTDTDINTPSGNYKGIEVVTEGENYKSYDYYVKDIGLVKSVYKSDDYDVETSLERIYKNAIVEQTIKFYYPDFLNDRLIFTKKKVNFKTNDDARNIFEENFKASPKKDISKLMSDKTKINRLYLNNSEYKVYIDFSKEFVYEMNAGTSLEAMIINSIANTLGDYYNVDKIYISIDGKPYSSGHIEINEGDSFYVNFKNVVELK